MPGSNTILNCVSIWRFLLFQTDRWAEVASCSPPLTITTPTNEEEMCLHEVEEDKLAVDTSLEVVDGKLISMASVASGVKGREKVVKEYDVVSYRPAYGKHGLENHHGVMNEWTKQNIPGYKEKAGKSPTVTLSDRWQSARFSNNFKLY